MTQFLCFHNIPQIKTPLISGLILLVGGISVGMTLDYTSPTYSQLQEEFSLSELYMTIFNISSLLAAFCGGLIMHFLVDFLGNRNCFIISGLIAGLSYLLLGISTHTWSLYLFRTVTGFTIGFFSTIVPVYLSEIAPEGATSLYGFFIQIGISFGFLIPTVVNVFTKWRQLTFICSAPGLICFLFGPFLPVKKPAYDTTKTVHASFCTVFKYSRELVISFFLMFFLQFSGINALLSNLNNIITSAKISMSTNLIATLANIVQIISTIIASNIVDRLGSKICWLASSFGQFIAFILLFLQQLLKLPAIVFIIGLLLEQLSYGIGTGPIPFAYTASLFKVEVQSSAMACTSGYSWILSVIAL